MQLVLVSGLSGSGKSIALKQLEDSGYYCIDNLPARFLVEVVEYLSSINREHVAVALDARSDIKIAQLYESLKTLKAMGVHVRTLCLVATTDYIVQRYSESRRQHPLSMQNQVAPDTLTEAIERERELLAPIFAHAHLIDTSGMLPSTLRQWIRHFINIEQDSLIITIESFGFKKGLPMASDLVFDVRCLPNPYWDKSLREYTGLDEPVIRFLEEKEEVSEMVSDISSFLEKWIPKYRAQDRHYLTISIGCTGGQHRSVYIAEQLGRICKEKYASVIVRHRTLDATRSAD